jgi:chromosome segregation ATPase
MKKTKAKRPTNAQEIARLSGAINEIRRDIEELKMMTMQHRRDIPVLKTKCNNLRDGVADLGLRCKANAKDLGRQASDICTLSDQLESIGPALQRLEAIEKSPNGVACIQIHLGAVPNRGGGLTK